MIDEPQTPSLLRRMACWLYEGMLIFGVMFIADYLFSTLTQTRPAMDNLHAQQIYLFMVFGIYFVWFWSHGKTLAMKTWPIRVICLKGGALSKQRALWRYILSWLWFLPPLAASHIFNIEVRNSLFLAAGWILFWALLSLLHSRRQFLHDALAGTRLVSFHQLPVKPA